MLGDLSCLEMCKFKIKMGRWPQYLSIKSIFLKYYDDSLQLEYQLSTNIIEGKLKVLETNLKSEEMGHYYSILYPRMKVRNT